MACFQMAGIVKMDDVLQSLGAQIFEVINSKAIWTSAIRITAVLNSLRNHIRSETLCRIIKWTLLKELPLDNPGGRVAGVGDN